MADDNVDTLLAEGKEKENKKKMLELAEGQPELRMQIMEQSNDVLIAIEKEYEDKKLALAIDYTNKVKQIEINANEERNDIIAIYNDKILERYERHFDSLIKQYENFKIHSSFSNCSFFYGQLQGGICQGGHFRRGGRSCCSDS